MTQQHDPVVYATPWHTPRETIIQKDIHTPIFIPALFTIARTWKQPKCTLTEEWMKKIWYMYTMEY